MQLVSSLLFAVSASLDSLIVGITYGIKKVHITFLQNILVSLITLAGTVVSIGLGLKLAPLLPPRAASLAGSAILILLGGYYILKYLISVIRNYLEFRRTLPGEIRKTSNDGKKEKAVLTLRETALLGAALSVNNMGIGIGASIAGLSLVTTAIVTFLFSVFLLFLGNRLGKIRLLCIADQFADPLSGLLLIALGICEFIF